MHRLFSRSLQFKALSWVLCPKLGNRNNNLSFQMPCYSKLRLCLIFPYNQPFWDSDIRYVFIFVFNIGRLS